MQTVLAIDDEPSVRQSYELILGQDYHVLTAEDGRSGLDTLNEKHVDIVLLDLTMPGLSGEEVLGELQAVGNPVPVIVVTASNSVTSAVEAMKLGAREYIIKPFDVDDLAINVERILRSEREKRELAVLRESDLAAFDSLIGSAPVFMEALAKARQSMGVDSTVLITGESGTGKDVLARAIYAGSARASKAFVGLSCCAIPMHLIESELFGYEKGAFTGADQTRIGKLQVADGGTLFLDEIGEMPMEAQAKLLRVLQDSRFFPVGSTKEIEVDIRVIAATNRDLMAAVQEGTFREDLYYRVNVLHIEMPSLRQRRSDIPELATHFAAKHAPRVAAKANAISPKAMARLRAHDWPGNIRELENVIERVLVYHGDEALIEAEHIGALLPSGKKGEGGSLDEYEGLPLEEATRKIERYLIRRALERNDQVQSRAADDLGTTRRILKYKMDQLGIES